jgi:hypothetical protein
LPRLRLGSGGCIGAAPSASWRQASPKAPESIQFARAEPAILKVCDNGVTVAGNSVTEVLRSRRLAEHPRPFRRRSLSAAIEGATLMPASRASSIDAIVPEARAV